MARHPNKRAAKQSGRRSKSQDTGRPGLIVSHFGVAVQVRFDDGASLKVKVKRNSGHVVGDRVTVADERLTPMPRSNALRRRDAFDKVRVLAANLDVLGIVVAPSPETPAGFVERAVVAARAADIEPFLVINKADLAGAEALKEQLCHDCPAVEHAFFLSAKTGDGVTALQDFLGEAGRGALVGVSGAGKSSLLNALTPGLTLQTGELSDDDHGCHTTSVSTLIQLPGGGELVDTPGFRDFAPVDVSTEELALWFPGFLSILEQQPCRFRNCRHLNEPGCSIKQAVEGGALPEQRFELYHQTRTELETIESAVAEGRKMF